MRAKDLSHDHKDSFVGASRAMDGVPRAAEPRRGVTPQSGLVIVGQILCATFLLNATYAAEALDKRFGKTIEQCNVPNASRHVWIFKQWHLAPGVDSTNQKDLPQRENQTAIYNQLEQWLSNKKITTVFAEGCSGELDSSSTLKINGWDMQALKQKAKSDSFAEVVSSVPLKLEAKFGDAVRTVCADDPVLLKENGLAFSDARAAVGFLTRIVQYIDDPARLKNYLEGIVDAYKMPPTTTGDQAVARLKAELKSAVKRVRESIRKRDEKAAEIIKADSSKNAAIVFGGIHADGIKNALEKARIGCSIVEPNGYQDSEAALLEQLEKSAESL